MYPKRFTFDPRLIERARVVTHGQPLEALTQAFLDTRL